MDLRLTFNEDAANYDKFRPTYSQELFRDIFEYSKDNETKKAIEVGIGTGQATAPFLNVGFDVTAIELGRSLAEFSRAKFREYKNFRVINTSFEDYQCDDNSFDILYSATAFHWIPDDIGYPKALRLLKDNGTLAVFWNKPFAARTDESVHQKMQSIYQKYMPSNKLIEYDPERCKKISEAITAHGFRDLEVKLYHRTRQFNADDYIALLNTYSDHRAMPAPTKQLLEEEVRNAILENNNKFNLYDTMDLYLARK